MRALLRIFISCGLLLGTWEGAAVTVDNFTPRTFTNAQGTLLYRLFVPTNYTASQKFPLVVYLHGSGERGSDNRAQLTGQTGALVFASETNQLKHPSFMIAPQCPSGGAWADSIRRAQVYDLVNALQAEFSIDPDRLYITGLSMGGYGTWDYIITFTNMYAAAVPMSAGGDTGKASRIIHLPIWNFHAANDGTVNVSGSRTMVQAVRLAGGNVIYTEYASGGHVIWTPAYNTPGLMGWVYSQRRGQASTNAPLLTITVPTSDPAYSTTSTSVLLGGTASPNVGITSVLWTNYQGTASGGVASGTTTWATPAISLDSNPGRIVVVTARGTSWSSSLGGTTTFNDTLAVAFRTVIVAQPQHQTTIVGGTAVFHVLAESTNVLSYQWRFNGVDISNATGPSLAIRNAQTNDAGSYSVMVYAAEGNALSSTAKLFVISQEQSALAPAGMVNWWPAEGSAADIFGTNHGIMRGAASYSIGETAQAFAFDGVSGYIDIGAQSLPPPWTASMWVKRQDAPGSSAVLMSDSNQRLKLEQYNGTRSVGLTVPGAADYSFGFIVPWDNWTHLAFVGTSTNTMLYVNGAYRSSIAASVSLPRAHIGAAYISSSSKFVDYMRGWLDEVLTFDRILTDSEIAGICSAGSAGLVRAPELLQPVQGDPGELRLATRSQTGKTVSLYGSSELTGWSLIETKTNPAGAVEFRVPTTSAPQRFYTISQP